MMTLSTGAPSTLGEYLRLARVVWGEGPACQFLETKIAESPDGSAEEVIADESQMVLLLHGIEAEALRAAAVAHGR